MTPLYPTVVQARRYLVYWQIQEALKRRPAAQAASEMAQAYLTHLPSEDAARLREEFKFPCSPS